MKRPYGIGDNGINRLKITYAGKVWVLRGETSDELLFRIAPVGGGVAADFLRNWRKRKKMSQKEAGKIFNLSQSAIAKMEKGDLKLSDPIIERIFKDNKSDYGKW